MSQCTVINAQLPVHCSLSQFIGLFVCFFLGRTVIKVTNIILHLLTKE